MDKICRFCLKTSKKNMCSLQECDIMYNVRRFLTLEISTDESFPNKICKDCFKKISQVTEFCLKIEQNEEKLQNCLNSGSLEDYYLDIASGIKVKDEDSENTTSATLKHIKKEVEDDEDMDTCLKVEFRDDDNNDTSDDGTIPKKLKPVRKRKRLNQAQHIIEANGIEIKPFTCLTCLVTCEDRTDLIKHYYAEHYTDSTISYTKHELDGKVKYTCDNCNKTCQFKRNIIKHVMEHHDNQDDKPLTCKICGRMYKTVPEIMRHSRAHTGARLQCSYNCGYTTAYQGALKEHENKHRGIWKYTCEICHKGFSVKTWYEQHQNLHTGEKPFACNICGLTFHMAKYLHVHKSSMHPQSSSVKRYVCLHCGLKCDSAKSLALHLEEHGINRENAFLCDFCGKIVPSAYQLKYHHQMHLGEKPYGCTLCDKRFAKKYNVKLHMITHSGEKDHGCVYCGKQYSQRPTLLKHLKSCPAANADV